MVLLSDASFGWGYLTAFAVTLALIVGAVVAVLVVMAAIGLPVFSVLDRLRKRRRREDPEEGGIDDLF